MVLISFSQKIKEDILVASARYCSVCHRYKGVKVEVHHIIPVNQGGEDNFENAIALCFDCHSDSGHYYAKHPRGTKFSPTELRKHKEAWNKIVKENNISVYKGVNLIHTVYYVTKNSDVIHEIANGNLSRFPIENVIVHANDILKFQKNILRDYRSTPGFERINDFPVEETKNYLLKYPDAEEVDENNYPNYLYVRTPIKEEVDKFCKKDKICRFLLKTGEDVKNIFKIFAYREECGETPYLQEILIKRDVWACYLCITNISNELLNIDSINYKGNSISNNQIAFREFIKNNDEFKLSLPKMQIPPKKSILIPILTLLAPFQGDDIEEYSSIEQELDYSEEAQVLSYGKLHETENSSNFLALGPGINPVSVNIFKDENISLQEIHRFDFSNLYFIDRMWMCGCCPYIFFKKERIKYFCEIFQKAPDMTQCFEIIVPKGVSSFILCELEYETTFISFIKINGKIIFQNRKIVKDESLEFKVKEGDIIEGSGFYTLSFKNIKQASPNRKNNIIKKFIMNNNYS